MCLGPLGTRKQLHSLSIFGCLRLDFLFHLLGEWRVYIKNMYLKQTLGILLFEDESKTIVINTVIFLSPFLLPSLSPYFYFMLFYSRVYD